MKNIAYSLCMTFLFGILCPSYQAYAKGKEASIALQKAQNKAKLSEDLIDKLASSKFFQSYYNTIFVIASYSSLSLSNKSEKKLKEITSKLEKISNKDLISDEDGVLEILGFNTDKNLNNTLNILKVKLNNNFPELISMNEIDKKEVIEAAIIKGNLESKALILLSKDQCYNDAANLFTKCTSGSKWWSATAAIACVICLTALVACLAVTAFATAGTGAVALAAALLPYTKLCITATLGMFNLSASFSTTCVDQNNVRVQSCVTQYGAVTPQGAE